MVDTTHRNGDDLGMVFGLGLPIVFEGVESELLQARSARTRGVSALQNRGWRAT